MCETVNNAAAIMNALRLSLDFITVVTRHVEFCVVENYNLLKSAGHVMHHQFNIQQLYVLPTLYICVLYLSENKQRLVPLTA